jgi:hypothetical protein
MFHEHRVSQSLPFDSLTPVGNRCQFSKVASGQQIPIIDALAGNVWCASRTSSDETSGDQQAC